MNEFPFNPAHIQQMALRQVELKDCGRQMLASLCAASTCKTLIVGSRIIAVCGFHDDWYGVRTIFVVPSLYINKHRFAFLRFIKRELDKLSACTRRLQTCSRADEDTDRWMRYLGFVLEGTMVGYSKSGQDYRMWSRINNGADCQLDYRP